MKVWAVTDCGSVRANNEDALYAGEVGSAALLVVADGMGGHDRGEVASQTAVDTVVSCLSGDQQGTWGDRLMRAIERAHQHIAAQRSAGGSPMGTTVTCAVIDAGRMVVGHVGDSRAYLWRKGQLRRITADHSLTGELERSGTLSEREMMNHPQRHILTRAVGLDQMPVIDIAEQDITFGDAVILCTDGLTSVVTGDEISHVIGSSTDDPSRQLVRMAVDRGGPDNVTVVVAVVDEGELEVMAQ